LTWSQRMTIWWTFKNIFVRSPVSAPLCRPPSFRSVLLQLQTIRGREKSGWAVVRSLAQRQSEFQSVSSPGLWRVQGMAGSQSGLVSSSF
jgi:hypothetical protein